MFRLSGNAVSITVTTLVLQKFTDIGRGFTVVFWGMAIVLLLTVAVIFAMPKSAADLAPSEKTGRPPH
jgi:hypothetical protein